MDLSGDDAECDSVDASLTVGIKVGMISKVDVIAGAVVDVMQTNASLENEECGWTMTCAEGVMG
jgi:hypothetical protein